MFQRRAILEHPDHEPIVHGRQGLGPVLLRSTAGVLGALLDLYLQGVIGRARLARLGGSGFGIGLAEEGLPLK